MKRKHQAESFFTSANYGKRLRKAPNEVFGLKAPDPSDTRPRNAFGIELSFGIAYSQYYTRKDYEPAFRDEIIHGGT